MDFASLRSRLPSIPSSSTSSEGPPSSFFSTLSSLPSSASSWSATLRGGQRPPLRAEATNDVDVDLVVSRLVYRAGEDDLGRPIVCFAPSLLPDPAKVPHDLLLDKITVTFSQYVLADYVLVVFAAGGRHYPDFKWFWTAWGRLGRPFRKNLKKLYLVHPNFFTKMLFTLAGGLISPKFFQKLVYLKTLSDLAKVVPLGQILVPPEAMKENLSYEQTVTLPTPLPRQTFGLPLSSHFSSSSSNLPLLIRQTTTFLRSNDHLSTEGLFRKSPSRGLLRAVEEAYDRGSPVDLDLLDDPHLAAVLIKSFFRELERPIVGRELYDVVRACPKEGDDGEGKEMADYVKEKIIGFLAPEAQRLLGHVIYLLHDASLLAPTNLMSSVNLAIVFTPNLVRSSNPAEDALLFLVPDPKGRRRSHPDGPLEKKDRTTTLGEIVRFLIDHPSEVFGEEMRLERELEGGTARPGSSHGGRPRSKVAINKEFFDPPESGKEGGAEEDAFVLGDS